MTVKLKEELLLVLGLLPLAVIDLRLKASSTLVCSDASSQKEAAVSVEIGKARTAECQQHELQKCLWNRLISPAKAFLREKGILDERPIWETVVKGCQFKQFGKVKKNRSCQRINLKEASAALRAEKLLGPQ